MITDDNWWHDDNWWWLMIIIIINNDNNDYDGNDDGDDNDTDDDNNDDDNDWYYDNNDNNNHKLEYDYTYLNSVMVILFYRFTIITNYNISGLLFSSSLDFEIQFSFYTFFFCYREVSFGPVLKLP